VSTTFHRFELNARQARMAQAAPEPTFGSEERLENQEWRLDSQVA
jgi:hypothetical protein